nr:hypothetical protein SPBC1346.03 [imported] - fission yeast (Schizosaccharomyces pombe) [Schizosaccharomyces pombe]
MGSAESKISFRHAILASLNTKPEREIYEFLFTCNLTENDVFSFILAQDIRICRDSNKFDNLAILLQVCVLNIVSIQNKFSEQYPLKKNALLNSFLILTRLLPYLYESTNSSNWVRTYFQKDFSQTVDDLKPLLSELGLNYEIELPNSFSNLTSLLSSTFQLCFQHEFTVSKYASSEESIWSAGIAIPEIAHPPSYDHRLHQSLLSCFLVVLLSNTLYDSIVLNSIVSLDAKDIYIRVICSFVNTGFIDSTNWFLNSFNQRRNSLQLYSSWFIILILSDARIKENTHLYANGEGQHIKNHLLELFKKLHRTQDFLIIAESINKFLSNPLKKERQIITFMGDFKRCVVESLCFLFLLLTNQPRFTDELVNFKSSNEMMMNLLFIHVKYSGDTENSYMSSLAGYCLQQLVSHEKLVKAACHIDKSLISPSPSSQFPVLCTLENPSSIEYNIISNILFSIPTIPLKNASPIVELISYVMKPEFFMKSQQNASDCKKLLSSFLYFLINNFNDNLHIIELLQKDKRKFEPIIAWSETEFSEFFVTSNISQSALDNGLVDQAGLDEQKWYEKWFHDLNIPLLRKCLTLRTDKNPFIEQPDEPNVTKKIYRVTYTDALQRWNLVNIWRHIFKETVTLNSGISCPWYGTNVKLFTVREVRQPTILQSRSLGEFQGRLFS